MNKRFRGGNNGGRLIAPSAVSIMKSLGQFAGAPVVGAHGPPWSRHAKKRHLCVNRHAFPAHGEYTRREFCQDGPFPFYGSQVDSRAVGV